MKELELYIHIPFCKQKCAYCDFLSFALPETEQNRYVEALLFEIECYRELANNYKVTTIFIGGGTPSILSIENMSQIIQLIKDIFYITQDVEFTIEINPGTVDEEKIRAYQSLGINRFSIGLQATNNMELKTLGRIHTYEKFLETYELSRKCGINNINIDLISSIPNQTVESWNLTLEKVVKLEPDHISAYSLIIEEGTKFHEDYKELEALLPDEEEERCMYYSTKHRLEEAGYERYEISNYAKKGKECKHNIGYWERKNYLGIGLGASSLLEDIRSTNERDFNRYIVLSKMGKSTVIEQELLEKNNMIEEFMFLGLRKINGVSAQVFEEEFGKSIFEVYEKPLKELVEKQLIQVQGNQIKLTEAGIDVSNYVMAEFLI
ncbi:MAG: radical SAM family heme chaperone HemW [Eubacteriales bacterium]